MSYSSVLMRVHEIEARLGVQPTFSNAGKQEFAKALRTARNRFYNAPTEYTVPLDTSKTGTTGAAGASAAALEPSFQQSAATHNVPVALVKAVARAESGFRADARSKAGALGIMQLMPGTARGLGVKDPFDPAQSIEGGARYLSNALRIFNGDVRLALAAYNAGTGAVRKYGGVPPFAETQSYVKRVLQYAREFGFDPATAGSPVSTGSTTGRAA